ncbi:hypothetical protein LCGC14_1053010 [marine sediment metagenome]|uniref:Uncharacterized protein n=1 Tax=marine sediment metagenome TaxID=412755 RepID=A0A0F9MSU1_9ZZZZ
MAKKKGEIKKSETLLDMVLGRMKISCPSHKRFKRVTFEYESGITITIEMQD